MPRFSPVRREDIGDVVAIERLSSPAPWSEALFAHEFEVPFSRLVAAWVREGPDESLVGFVCRWLVADEIHILNLAVHPKHRHAGIGSALVGIVIAEARERGMSQVTLEVRVENATARSLYSKLGFREKGRRRDYYGRGEDAVVMTLKCAARSEKSE